MTVVLVQALFLVEARVTEASLPRFAPIFEARAALASTAYLAFSSFFPPTFSLFLLHIVSSK